MRDKKAFLIACMITAVFVGLLILLCVLDRPPLYADV